MGERAQPLIAPAIEEELNEHQGRWVALTAVEIVAVGDSYDDVSQHSRTADIVWVADGNSASQL